ncbi:MAG: hypothetical protein H0W40_18570 [Methylibium sp.]|uniref:hypothetical protein n=1 Tax=Methylibium sp. TaxID=2067992 RepID=UPI001813B1E4|nr:hypothetical protein [Methylibium sp.]MBA3599354.1 hypothetical protein [Methylibium sp.]
MTLLSLPRAILLAALVLPMTAWASPADYIFSPVVEDGEREIDSKAGIARDRDGRSAWAGSIGLEYGVNSWWATEATVNFGREAGASTRLDSLEWENRLQFTETGRRPYEIGLLFEVERATRSDDGWELRYGPLLQAHWGALQANLNLLFERRLLANEQEPTEFGYQWQLRARSDGALDWGAQGFGELGRWDRWATRSEQSHILGPALFARLGQDDDDPQVEAGLLLGTGGAAPRATLRLQAMIPF